MRRDGRAALSRHPCGWHHPRAAPTASNSTRTPQHPRTLASARRTTCAPHHPPATAPTRHSTRAPQNPRAIARRTTFRNQPKIEPARPPTRPPLGRHLRRAERRYAVEASMWPARSHRQSRVPAVTRGGSACVSQPLRESWRGADPHAPHSPPPQRGLSRAEGGSASRAQRSQVPAPRHHPFNGIVVQT